MKSAPPMPDHAPRGVPLCPPPSRREDNHCFLRPSQQNEPCSSAVRSYGFVSDDEFFFLSLGIWVCFRSSPWSLCLFHEAKFVFALVYLYLYVDMYDIFYYYTRRIDLSIFWVTRYVLVCGRFNPICGRCVVINMVSDNVQKGGVPRR
jgi:hypothetical protein